MLLLVFAAPSPNLTYRWMISSGKVIHGQGTPSIQIAPALSPDTGRGVADVRVEIGGLPTNCTKTASISLSDLAIVTERMVDEISAATTTEDENRRLDNFAAQLEKRAVSPGLHNHV